MIIIHYDGVNAISQDIYDKMLEHIDLLLLTCPHCKHTGTVVHAYYDRAVKSGDGSRLLVLRIKCRFCNKTHTILPDTLVPYSSINLEDTINIICSDSAEEAEAILKENINLDLSDIYRVKRNYRLYWKERLHSFRIPIDEDVSRQCISLFKRQFMQIHCTVCGSYG